MSDFLVPTGDSVIEFTEKRSRFIGRVWKVETEQEALERIRETRERHWDATHNVYAYIVKDEGIMRYSDDGEPGGTAGMPTLEVFRRENITNFCCVVTRYFGGTLLGTGGLVRAYGNAAKMALDAAGVSVMGYWDRCVMECSYSFYERMRIEVESHGGVVEETDFTDKVTMRVLLPGNIRDDFEKRVTEISAGSVVPKKTGECLRAVPVKK